MPTAAAGRFRPTPVFRESRRPRLARVILTNARGERLPVMVRDVSARGLSAAARGTPPALDEVVCVTLPDRRELWGLVRWVAGNCFGVEFDTSTPYEESRTIY